MTCAESGGRSQYLVFLSREAIEGSYNWREGAVRAQLALRDLHPFSVDLILGGDFYIRSQAYRLEQCYE
jgi:hypothetical protein